MAGDLDQTWRLLKPHALPRVKGLLLVLALGAISAAAQAAPLALLLPRWHTVFFPELPPEGYGTKLAEAE